MISASRNMVLGFPPVRESEKSEDVSMACPKCGQDNFVRRLRVGKYFCTECDTEFDVEKKLINYKRKRVKKRKIFNHVEELNLTRLLIKIERLRYKLNSTNLEDKKRLLFLSQKLDELIVAYQRALSSAGPREGRQ